MGSYKVLEPDLYKNSETIKQSEYVLIHSQYESLLRRDKKAFYIYYHIKNVFLLYFSIIGYKMRSICIL